MSEWIRAGGACECCFGDAYVLANSELRPMGVNVVRVRCDLCRQVCKSRQCMVGR